MRLRGVMQCPMQHKIYPQVGLHYTTNSADMQHCFSFYSKDFKSSHCKHFFHEVSSLNAGMPTTLIPNSINQTADHLCNGFSAWLPHKNLRSPPLHPHPVDKNTCVGQLRSSKNNKKSHALFFDLLLTVTAAASIEPAARIIETW